jgi:hypothetical protein
LKVSAVLLTIWSVLNVAVAVAVTEMTVAGAPAPALRLVMGEAQMHGLDARLLAVISAQAAFCNPCIVALCLLVTVIAWKGLMARARWAWWALVLALLPLQLFAFVSDAFIGWRCVSANVASTVVLSLAFALAAWGLRGQARPETQGQAQAQAPAQPQAPPAPRAARHGAA